MADEKVEVVPSIGISYKATPANDREIVFQTFVPQETSPEAINALLDKLATAANRQGDRVLLIQLKNELEKHEKHRRQMKEDVTNIARREQDQWEETGKRGPFKLSQKTVTAKAQAEGNIKRWDEEIAKLKEQIQETEARAK